MTPNGITPQGTYAEDNSSEHARGISSAQQTSVMTRWECWSRKTLPQELHSKKYNKIRCAQILNHYTCDHSYIRHKHTCSSFNEDFLRLINVFASETPEFPTLTLNHCLQQVLDRFESASYWFTDWRSIWVLACGREVKIRRLQWFFPAKKRSFTCFCH